MKNIISIILLFSFSACNQTLNDQSKPVTTTRQIGKIGQEAMVVSAHQEASKVGLEILRKGGNAFDAAIAVQFALAVVYPQAGNIGGGGFAVFRHANGEIGSLDFREKAPKSASKDMYLDKNGNVIKNLSIVGHKAYGVPGSVDGMVKLHEKFGSMPFRNLVQPSVNLAYDGVVLSEYQAQMFNRFKDVFIEQNGAKNNFVKDSIWNTGDTIFHKALAGTLAQIRDNGRAGFYEGIVADQIVKNAIRGKGLITYEDLNDYQSVWRTPAKTKYKAYDIISMPPPSSGGIALNQLFMGSALFDFTSSGHNTVETIHAMVELERRVYADRATFLGDPDFVEVPEEMLLSNEYNQKRFSDISVNKKTPSSEVKEGKVDIIESVETTHFSIVDKKGNAVSITTTINGYFGSKVIVRGAGFFMNNEMDDFSAKPGVPNQFGLVGAEANAIAPEKRMLSSMTPTIVLKNDSLFMVVGTPGGSTIITSVYQTILNVVDHGMTMQEAVNAPKFHHQWLPDVVLFEENRFDEKLLSKLEKMDHVIQYRPMLGKVESILIKENGELEGAADYTRNPDSFAAGY